MRYLSVCAGIEAATVAWHGMGWEAAAYSEIEPFPSAVLAHHYQDVPNVGDMTKYKEWNLGAIDLLVGGTPCQSFSVAGLRKGLEDPRGNLALVYCGILDHYRPQWFVWENVPGVLSSNGGRDFGSFLGALAQLGYGFAYRVLDAQYWGVAQRRRRVFVVGHLGDWRPAAEVLFEPQGLSRDTQPSREKRQETAGNTPLGLGPDGQLARALNACKTAAGRMDVSVDTFVAMPTSETFPTLLSSTAGVSRTGNAVTEHETYIPMAPIPYDLHQVTAPVNRQARSPSDPCHTLAKQNAHNAGVVSIQGTLIGREAGGPQGAGASDEGVMYTPTKADVHGVSYGIRTANTSSNGWGIQQEITHTLDTAQGVAVAQPINIYGGNKRPDRPEGGFYVRMDEETSKTLDAVSGLNPTCSQGGTAVMQSMGIDYEYNPHLLSGPTGPLLKGSPTGGGHPLPAVMQSMAVRRLTPVECERLQGFPDNYTEIPWRGKTDTPDGPRYKALGNSMAVPVMRWIGERINAQKS